MKSVPERYRSHAIVVVPGSVSGAFANCARMSRCARPAPRCVRQRAAKLANTGDGCRLAACLIGVDEQHVVVVEQAKEGWLLKTEDEKKTLANSAVSKFLDERRRQLELKVGGRDITFTVAPDALASNTSLSLISPPRHREECLRLRGGCTRVPLALVVASLAEERCVLGGQPVLRSLLHRGN